MDGKAKHLDPAYQTTLIVCALLNVAMLFAEGSVGLWIGSAALLADAGDFLESGRRLSGNLDLFGQGILRYASQFMVSLLRFLGQARR